jgi:hypothetical protein
MCISNLYDPYVELATDVFQSRNPVLFKALRDFLTGLPSSSCGEDILTAAFHQLALNDTEACRWLLRNSFDLLPEIDFVEQAMGLAKMLLQSKGFLFGQDFSFDSNGQITLCNKAKSGLFAGTSVGDRLLLEEILHIYIYD